MAAVNSCVRITGAPTRLSPLSIIANHRESFLDAVEENSVVLDPVRQSKRGSAVRSRNWCRLSTRSNSFPAIKRQASSQEPANSQCQPLLPSHGNKVGELTVTSPTRSTENGLLFIRFLLVRRSNRRGVVNEKVTRKWISDPHRPRVMRSRSQERRRSVDRGTCGPGIQPRKTTTPGRRRCKEKRKAPSGAPISRGVPESRAVRDPVHVRRHLAREPGDPRSAQGSSSLGTHREV